MDMTTIILFVLATYLASVFAALAAYLPTEGLFVHLGGRDNLPAPGRLASRLSRATTNMQESLFLFLPLALLAMISTDVDATQALVGAQIYAVARLAYIPAYAVSVFGLRSVIWVASVAGLGAMALALL